MNFIHDLLEQRQKRSYRVLELESKIEAMRSEHEEELVYIGQQHAKAKEVLTSERDQARGELLAVAIELGRVSDSLQRWVDHE